MVEDVRVQVHTYDAEMGRTGGGVFNTTARSGSNQFHGSGFYLSRPGALVGPNFFNEIRGLPTNDQYWRNGGGGVGGPIIRGKTFFWFAGRRLPGRAVAEQHPALPDRGDAPRRLQRPDRFAGPPDRHLRPADRRCQRKRPSAVLGQHHPDQPSQPGRPVAGQRVAAARGRASTTAARTTTARTSSSRSPSRRR